MNITETLILIIVVLITLALLAIKLNPNCVLFLKRSSLDIYCLISNKSIAEAFKELHFELRASNYKSASARLCLRPYHILTDNELIKSVLQTDFQHFTHRGLYFNSSKKAGIIDENILNSFHNEWKFARTKLKLAFTPNRMEKLIQRIKISCKQMIDAVNLDLSIKKDVEVDIEQLSEKYFSNIGNAFVFGLGCDAFQDERSEKFHECASKLFTGQSFWRNSQVFLAYLFPQLGTRLGILFAPKEIADIFIKSVDEIVTHPQQNIVLQDSVLKLMMDLHNKGAMTKEEVAAQCLIFYHGVLETSSITFSFCLYELAKNQAVQEKLREEINRTYELNEDLTYEALESMEYLRRVIAETLRKYPPVPLLTRKCTKSYKIPNSNELIKEGTVAIFSILGLHHDPEYYPNPLKFDPDRFIPEVAESRPPFTYLPFGGGPRNCIARRLAYIQVKLGLTSLLRNFKFSINENTIMGEPLPFRHFLMFLKPQHKILLTVEKI